MIFEATKDSIIDEGIKAVPGAEKIIEKFFGSVCFIYPGINIKSIVFGAMIHNIDPEKIVSEIKKTKDPVTV